MCGIAGFYHSQVAQPEIDALVGSLRHRGPDDQRVYRHGNVGLIHTRLSILELSELGAQPYCFEDLALVFNGELYNYKEVRTELQKKGYAFQSNSDTEVLIKAFHCWGEQCVSRFIGMFAFAVYKETTDQLWLFRDRLGVKPLYYAWQNKQLCFASELKALRILQRNSTINTDAVHYYFRFGFVPGARSIFEKISKLEAGHYLAVKGEEVQIKKYWAPAYTVDRSRTEAQWTEALEDTMISAFKYRMVSDVPVGVFLSGGIDSSLLAAILKKHYGPIHSFTIGFEESGFDESVYARQVANHLKIDHTEKTLKLAEAKEILQQFYTVYDEPFADTSGIPTACVTRLAKENGIKVVLSADGGDELFAGYTHYQKAARLYQMLQSVPLQKYIAALSRKLIPPAARKKIFAWNFEHKLYALEELMGAGNPTHFFEAFIANQATAEVNRLLNTSASETYLANPLKEDEPLQHMMAWDLKYYLTDDLLVKVDRATMYHSLECRDPFLDHRLVELAMQMPLDLKIREGKNKYIVRKLLQKHVPEQFFERRKQGFSIPIFAWFSQELDALFKTHLSSDRISAVGLFNTAEVEKEYAKYLHYKIKGQPYNIEKMWRLVSFMLWWEKHVANNGR
jgi:asparagine synthase (glutamine-hydrolysing)